MDIWDAWLEMAENSLIAAEVLEEAGDECSRASANRYYYAAYQSATALLLYIGLTPPTVDGTQWEGWGHEQTFEMMVTNTGGLIGRVGKRQELRHRLLRLYKIRVYADYASAGDVSLPLLQEVRKSASYICRFAEGLIR